MRDLITLVFLGISALLYVVALLAIWVFPVIISFITGNWWLILLYSVWWIPAIALSAVVTLIWDSVEEVILL